MFICIFPLLISFAIMKLLRADTKVKKNMYLADDLMYECFSQEEFNNFQFWREPIMELTLDDFDLCDVDVKDAPFISNQYDSFLYWRDPIPDLDEL